jgi:hypothetical protein
MLPDAAVAAVVLANVGKLHDAAEVHIAAKIRAGDRVCMAEQRLVQHSIATCRAQGTVSFRPSTDS